MLTAIGQSGAVDTGVNPLKIMRSDHFLHQIQVMLDGWKKEDPPTVKKLPIEVDIPEYLVRMVTSKDAEKGQNAMAILILIAFYNLLREGEYTCKQKVK